MVYYRPVLARTHARTHEQIGKKVEYRPITYAMDTGVKEVDSASGIYTGPNKIIKERPPKVD